MMGVSSCERDISEKIIDEISYENMRETVLYFNQLHRYTGYPQAEEAAAYLVKKLHEYGVPCEGKKYEAYLSLPLSASFFVTEPELMEFTVIGDAYSCSAAAFGELCCVDKSSWDEEHLLKCKEKILLTDMGGEAASEAKKYGVRAFVHTSISSGNVVHHRTAGTVWGNPSLATLNAYSDIVSMSIGKEDGNRLRELMAHKKVIVRCSARMDNAVRKSTMPVAKIEGRTKSYVLVSGHYDSWYEGITDNATSNAIMLELSRIFWKYRGELERGICFAWWSGHSDGRYSGSAWYCDNHWKDLRKNCVGHINLDLCGCKNTKQVIARTTRMEGSEFTDKIIERFTGKCPKEYAPMIRGADQSFWGTNIPITIMLKYEPKPEERITSCPGGGVWWHTPQDTLDKMAPEFLIRDAKMNGLMAAQLCVEPILPIDISGFLKECGRFISEIEITLPEEMDLKTVKAEISKLSDLEERLRRYLKSGEAEDYFIKETSGELVRLMYTERGRFEQDEAVLSKPFPGLQRAVKLLQEEKLGFMRLAAQTTFMRQCNRLAEGLGDVCGVIEERLKMWEESNE